MGIGEQFAGLDMANLIGGPLTAAADASVLLAQSTADFVNRVGFDAEKNARKVQFSFQKKEPDVDGSINQSEMKVDVPLLAIVPIPNLQIDEVNVLFDMEVKQCEKSEQSLDVGAKIEAGLQVGPLKVSITGSVSAHSSNTRSSDNSAKYHVDVRATNHGTPEGLARVLDMMAANVAPTLISSKPVDECGKELDGGRKARNLQLRALREKKFQNETAVRAAAEVYDNKLKALLDKAAGIEMAQRLELSKPGEVQDAEGEPTPETENKLREIASCWEKFRTTAKAIVGSACEKARTEEGTLAQEKIGTLGQRVKLLMVAPYDTADDPALAAMETLFTDAVAACNELKTATAAMDDNNVEYNKVMMGSM